MINFNVWKYQIKIKIKLFNEYDITITEWLNAFLCKVLKELCWENEIIKLNS